MQHMWNIFAVYVNQKLVKNIFDFFASKIPKIFWQPMWNILCHFSVTYVLAAYVDSLCNRSLCRCSLCGNFIILHICKKSLTSMWIFDHLCKNSLCRAAYVVAAYVTKNEYWWSCFDGSRHDDRDGTKHDELDGSRDDHSDGSRQWSV